MNDFLGLGLIIKEQTAELERLRAIIVSDTHVLLSKRPVAFRVKDHGDGWILCHTQEVADHEAEEMGGAFVQSLYARENDQQ